MKKIKITLAALGVTCLAACFASDRGEWCEERCEKSSTPERQAQCFAECMMRHEHSDAPPDEEP